MEEENFEIMSENTDSEISPEEDSAALSEENKALKMRMECMERGVRSECIDDVIRLAADRSIGEVIGKYPVFVSGSISTGVSMRDVSTCGDDMLRKAFGLKSK